MNEEVDSRIIDLESLLNENRSIAAFMLEIFRDRLACIDEFPPYIVLLHELVKNLDEALELISDIIEQHE